MKFGCEGGHRRARGAGQRGRGQAWFGRQKEGDQCVHSPKTLQRVQKQKTR